MRLDFYFESMEEARHVIAAIKAYPKSESEETQQAMIELVNKIARLIREAEDENRNREADGLPY